MGIYMTMVQVGCVGQLGRDKTYIYNNAML